MKKIKITLTILILVIFSYGIYRALDKEPQIDPYEQKIQAIMQEQDFIKSIRLQAETIQAKRDKEDAEKRLEGFRKQELELASTTKSSLK